MIGFFDSGLGGLTILKEAVKTLPDYSYIYLGDNARTPYGSRSGDIIYQYTCEGVEELFSRGANLVVLACNTSSAVALKKIQQEYLSKYHPDKKVLGIIIPTVEEAGKFSKKTVGVFATEATVESNAFAVEMAKENPHLIVVQQACPLLVPIIESGEWDMLDGEVKKYADALFSQNETIDAVILGCTHFAIIENIFRKHIPQNVRIILQGKIVAEKLKKYLEKHPEIEAKLQKTGGHTFLTTEKSGKIQHLAELFFGADTALETVNLDRLK